MNGSRKVLKKFISSLLIVFMLMVMMSGDMFVTYASEVKSDAGEMVASGNAYTTYQMKKAAVEAIKLYKAGKGASAYLDPKFIAFKDLNMDGVLELYIMDISGGGEYWGYSLKYENGSYNEYKSEFLGKTDTESNDEVYVNKNNEYIFLEKLYSAFLVKVFLV